MKYHFLVLLAIAAAICASSCGNAPPASDNTSDEVSAVEEESLNQATATYEDPYLISLAQWSLHRAYESGERDPYLFARDAKELGFDGIEYVSQLYEDDIVMDGSLEEHSKSVLSLASELDAKAKAAGIPEVLIMIDHEGDLAGPDEASRQTAIARHQHWIDAAWGAGIPTVRINLSGGVERDEARAAAIASLRQLGVYASPKGINVVVENHGGFSSDPSWLQAVMTAVAMPNVGTLPDFGNWCRTFVNPDRWSDGCVDAVPVDSTYIAVGMWMPFAHAVSAKSYEFAEDGTETSIDYARMLDTVRASGYNGFIGVEYEGDRLSEVDGILATKALLEQH